MRTEGVRVTLQFSPGPLKAQRAGGEGACVAKQGDVGLRQLLGHGGRVGVGGSVSRSQREAGVDQDACL